MADYIGSPPAAPDYYGYSCQAWLAVRIRDELHSAENRWVWFSLQFNPINNVDSSNPCLLYLQLSRAVRQGDVGSRIIKNYKSQLLGEIDKSKEAGRLTGQIADDYKRQVISASVEWFRPEVWRLDLRKISRQKYGNENVAQLTHDLRQRAEREIRPPQILQPNEYLIDDLKNEEFDIIITG